MVLASAVTAAAGRRRRRHSQQHGQRRARESFFPGSGDSLGLILLVK